jgi:molybdate transport system regulatory protein
MSVEPKTKVWLERHGDFVMGDGGLHLLHAIRERGSLTLAARDVGWSYRHAWEYIRRAERTLGVALTGAVPGKGANRGTALTPNGVGLLDALARLRDRVDRAVGASGPTPEEVASRGRRPPGGWLHVRLLCSVASVQVRRCLEDADRGRCSWCASVIMKRHRYKA